MNLQITGYELGLIGLYPDKMFTDDVFAVNL